MRGESHDKGSDAIISKSTARKSQFAVRKLAGHVAKMPARPRRCFSIGMKEAAYPAGRPLRRGWA